MIITIDKLNGFYDVLQENANTYCLSVSMETNGTLTGSADPVSNIMISDGLDNRLYVVRWKEAKSLTEAATPILADALVYFGKVPTVTRKPVLESRFDISNVIFNGPATIVMWKDGTKTVVKCQDGDCYSEETGLALCFMKKALGNKPNFNNAFRKWIPEHNPGRDFEDLIKILLASGTLK